MLKLKSILIGHQNPIYSLALSPLENRLFSVGADKGVVEWNLFEGSFKAVTAPIQLSSYSLHAYDQYLALAERLGKIKILDIVQNKVLAESQVGEKAIFGLQYLAQNNELWAIGEDGFIYILDAQKANLIKKVKITEQALRGISLHRDQNLMLIGDKLGNIHQVSTQDQQIIQVIPAHSMGITALSFAPKGDIVYSGGRDAQLKIWNYPSFTMQAQIPAHMNSIYGIATHPNLPIIATASQDKSIKIWHADDYRLLKILSIDKNGEGHKHTVNSLLWDNTGKYLVSAGDDRQIIVWEFTD